MNRDPQVDAYIAGAGAFAQPILCHLRDVIHRAVPGLTEAIKWRMPHFVHGGKNLAGIAAFKSHAALIVHGDDRVGEGMGSYGKIARLAELPADEILIARLIEARSRIDAGMADRAARPLSPKPRTEPVMQPDFAAALAGHVLASAHFAGFAPSHRREYLEWIGEAKQAQTLARRIAQALEWLAEGKQRHWKHRK